MEQFIQKCNSDRVVETTIFAVGMCHAVPLSTYVFEHPFRTLFNAANGGFRWLACLQILRWRWLGFPRELQGLLVPMTVASLVYLKYREYQGVPSEEDPEEE